MNTNPNQTDTRALLFMSLTVLIWGSGWVVMKYLVPFIGSFDLVVVRYALGFLTLVIIQLALRQRFSLPPLWFTLGIAVFQTTAYQCLVQLALVTGGTGRVVMVAYTMPFWAALFAWGLMGDRPTRQHCLGFVLAGVGLVAVISPWQGMGTVLSSVLALGGGMAWALGTVISKKMFRRHAPNVLNLMTWQMLLGTLMALPFVWFFPQPPIVWQPGMLLGLLYLGVFASAVAWALWLLVVRRVHPTIAGMSGLGVPVLAIVIAWIALGERPATLELVGMVLMLAGLIAVNIPPGVFRLNVRKPA